MAYLIANLPPVDCYVRMEYLYDLQKDDNGKLLGQGKYTPAVWVTVKSISGKALYIESLLPEYGALYDKLPLSAYVWKTDADTSKFLPLDHLEIWDSFSYYITVLEKATLSGLRCSFLGKDKKMHSGEYMFTIDSCHSNDNELNTTFSEVPDEHKSFNIMKLDNGQYAAQPNNRMRWFEQSLVSHETKMADFKVSTREYSVEDNPKWSANYGDGDTWAYELKEHKTKIDKPNPTKE